MSPVRATINRNKLSIGIDLKAEEGKRLSPQAPDGCGRIAEGFRPGTMKRLGFSLEAVGRVNPRIVYCSISTYGQTSRLSSMPGWHTC